MELYANYHTHTSRCGHAFGTDREYVEAAIDAGIKILGFSDHSPMVFDTPGYYSGFRMKPEETGEYFASLTALKEEYKNEIEIHIGVEAEYYPATHNRFMDFITQFPIEYLLLGQHFILREENREGSSRDSADPDRMKRYFANVLEGAATGNFMYIAHPDMINFIGDEDVFLKEAESFLKEVKRLDVPIEINRLGYSEKRHYPRDSFWRLAGQLGMKAVIGMDAHTPAHLKDNSGVLGCKLLAASYGLEVCEALQCGIKK